LKNLFRTKTPLMKTIICLSLLLLTYTKTTAQGIESGLVAKYCFSGNANDALGVRNATVYGASLTTDRFGTANEAYLLDGIDDYIQMPSDYWVSGNFSFSGWILLNGYGSWARFFEWGNGIDKDNVFYSPYQSGSTVFTIHKCSSSARTYAYNSSTIPTSVWTHIVITLTGDTARIYKNNVFWYSYKMIDTPCSVIRTQCYFGKSNYPNPYLNGKIDDIRIYNRAISVAEIDTIYKLTGCSPVSVPDPCAGTKADFKDSSTSCYAFQFTDLSVTDDASIASWSWDFGDLSSSTSKNPSHTYADYGTYNVRLIIHSSSGCIDTISKSITVKYKHFASAGMDTTLCLNNGSATAFLRGNGGISYDWTPTKNLSHPNAKNTYATVANSTPFYLSVVDSFGCKDRDTVNVNVFPKMNLRNSPKDTSVCMGSTIRLNASGAKSYQWTPPTGLDFPMLKNPSLTVTSPKTLIVTATDANGCIAFDTVNIKLNPDAQINITPKNPIACEGDSIAFSASGGVAYKWYPADGLSNDSIANPKHYTKGVAKYLVKGLNAAGCEGMDSVIVNQYPNPIVEASSLANGNIVTCKGASIRLDASGASNYDWSPAEFCLNPSASSTEVFPTQTTVFTVIGTDKNGCQANDTISVIYDGKEKVFVPSSFTPNDDGINDRIGIVDQCNIQFLSIDIFNRWGQNIYSGYNLNDKWDGTTNGKTCEMGTYFYLIKARTLTGEPINFKGDITLIR
jgi:gliding motility-associated-like protein